MEYFLHSSSIVDEPCSIGKGTKIWHFCHVSRDSKIGEGCILGQNVFIADGVILGNNVKIQNNVSVYRGVICEDDVFLGPSCVFTNVLTPRSAVVRRGNYEETYLEKGVTIGANATILCGIRLGAYALVGAGAVVTKSFPAYALITGNPARQTGWVSEYGHRLNFENNDVVLCPESGEAYKRISDGGVIKILSDEHTAENANV
jgi:UDP-2-acetamido-3-amino-2,3-dideoxy-glucuronate N-acetyltransferase